MSFSVASLSLREDLLDELQCNIKKLIELEIHSIFKSNVCSGSMIPDTNVGSKIATINEVSDDQKTTFLYS